MCTPPFMCDNGDSMFLKRWLVGDPLKSTQARHERLSKTLALAIFSSNAISSVAYASEEILLVLVLAGTAAIAWSIPISLAILFLVVVLTISYRQIIYEYPEGGGAYIVARNNLGELPALTAAAALMIDYVLTVAVSVAAGIAALTSAVPGLFEHREALGLVAIIFIIVMNLRGVRESGKFFAIPTYFAIGALGVMVVVGSVQALFGQAVSVSPGSQTAVEELTLFLILRSFAAGCSAVTGMEVISNGVKAFRRPESQNASTTMIHMSLILAALFMGISFLADHYGVLPKTDETIISQLARLTFGTGALYYALQIGTMLLLVLAANSAFAGFPHLCFDPGARRLYAPSDGNVRRPLGVLKRDRHFRGLRLFPPDPLSRRHARLDPAIRSRRVHLLHVVPNRHGTPMADEEGASLAKEPDCERRGRRHDRYCHHHPCHAQSLHKAPGSSSSSFSYWSGCSVRSARTTRPSQNRSRSRVITVLQFHDAISSSFPSVPLIKRSFEPSITRAVVPARFGRCWWMWTRSPRHAYKFSGPSGAVACS